MKEHHVNAASSVVIAKALDGLSARYLAIAENVANANSRDFRPLRVSFEEALKAAASQGDAAVRNVALKAERSAPSAMGGEMRLDLELADGSETAMRYAALLDLLGRQMQISRTIIRGGQ
jgi:flagellar basal-body rod protein FlgB